MKEIRARNSEASHVPVLKKKEDCHSTSTSNFNYWRGYTRLLVKILFRHNLAGNIYLLPFFVYGLNTLGRPQASWWKKTDPDGVRNWKFLLTYSTGSWSWLLFKSIAFSVSRHAAFLLMVQRADIGSKYSYPFCT